MAEGSKKPEATSSDEAFDKLYLGIFDESDAGRFLRSPMLRATFGADYAKRIDFTTGDVLRAVLQAVDVLKDPGINVVTRAKAQLLLDAATASQVDLGKIGVLGEYMQGIQQVKEEK